MIRRSTLPLIVWCIAFTLIALSSIFFGTETNSFGNDKTDIHTGDVSLEIHVYLMDGKACREPFSQTNQSDWWEGFEVPPFFLSRYTRPVTIDTEGVDRLGGDKTERWCISPYANSPYRQI